MKIFKKIIFLTVIPMIVLQSSVLAAEYSSLGDFGGGFSERSVIMKSLYKKESLNQEQKDLLAAKKLSPTDKCFFEQIKKGNIENVRLLLDAKMNPNTNYYSEYPVYYASKLNQTEIVKLLLEYGAKLDHGFYSELYEAVKNKNTELAQLLLDNGAKVNYQDSLTGNSIIYYALKNDMYDIARQLILKGARPDKKSVMIIKKKKLQNLIEEN